MIVWPLTYTMSSNVVIHRPPKVVHVRERIEGILLPEEFEEKIKPLLR